MSREFFQFGNQSLNVLSLSRSFVFRNTFAITKNITTLKEKIFKNAFPDGQNG